MQIFIQILTKIFSALWSYFNKSNTQTGAGGGWVNDTLNKVIRTPKTTVEYLQEYYDKYGGVWDPEINIFGIRSEEGKLTDKFQDHIGVAFLDRLSGTWQWRLYRGTTRPGRPRALDASAEGGKGASYMSLGWHAGIWVIGPHRGPRRPDGTQFIVDPALIALGAAQRVWNDSNQNGEQDADEKTVLRWNDDNCHAASASYTGKASETVGNYSWGCQVIQVRREWDEFISFPVKSLKYRENPKAKFGYMLFAKGWLPKEFWIAG